VQSAWLPRNRATARMMLSGFKVNDIAKAFWIEHQTAKNYMREVYDLIGASSRLEAVIMILRSEDLLNIIYELGITQAKERTCL